MLPMPIRAVSAVPSQEFEDLPGPLGIFWLVRGGRDRLRPYGYPRSGSPGPVPSRRDRESGRRSDRSGFASGEGDILLLQLPARPCKRDDKSRPGDSLLFNQIKNAGHLFEVVTANRKSEALLNPFLLAGRIRLRPTGKPPDNPKAVMGFLEPSS